MKSEKKVEKTKSYNTTWLSALTLLLTVAALVVTALALQAGNELYVASASEFFYSFSRAEEATMIPMLIACGAGAIAAIGLSIAAERSSNKLASCFAGIFKIAVPALLMVSLLYLAFGSLTGLGWTFFSNAELVIFAEAKAVGYQVIAALALLFVAAILAIINAFLPTKNGGAKVNIVVDNVSLGEQSKNVVIPANAANGTSYITLYGHIDA